MLLPKKINRFLNIRLHCFNKLWRIRFFDSPFNAYSGKLPEFHLIVQLSIDNLTGVSFSFNKPDQLIHGPCNRHEAFLRRNCGKLVP
ncbi:hypothetical protein D3C75_761460 [compost metagenome]